MKTIRLVPDHRYTNQGNLVFFATYLVEHCEHGQRLAIKIPLAIYHTVDKNEFNQCFTEILMDHGFTDDGLVIKISDNELFEVYSY
jgi:hypothetical protein